MYYITQYIEKLYTLILDMAPWLILGFLIAGILHVFFPDGKINKLLGKTSMKSVIRAAIIGIPLPLCSCGVIPTGVSIHKNGASKGASVSFLISTPQTGVDSILVTYSLLGLPFAIVRPIAALITGVFGGAVTNKLEASKVPEIKPKAANTHFVSNRKSPIYTVFHYAFVEFLEDIAKWLVIGLLIAALIAVFVPDDFFATYIHNDFIGMLIILFASIPVYVCATSSVPIAAVLMMKGVSPGAALVFLMAGPATNAATISVVGNSMGRKTLFIYLGTLITGALASGLFIDYFLPRHWFTGAITQLHPDHVHGLLPYWLQLISGIFITLLLLNIFVKKLIKKVKREEKIVNIGAMNEIRVFVRGMHCNHCKISIESNLNRLEGVEKTTADIDNETVTISGNNIDLNKVKKTVESLGYKFVGEVA
ncbi:MAG: permease [Bacteroidales bacterium]|nr:permease [Bacteroidales bacterium]